MNSTKLILFGDQTVEKRSSIQSLVRISKRSAAARRFLQEATDLVHLNFDRLSREDRAWNHRIHSLLGLAEDNIEEENPNGVIATVLMCVGRLGNLIVHAEEDPSILGSDIDPVHVLAFCTGLLPAAAVVAARDTSELFKISREIISITFRMAHEIIRRMELIEHTNLSWAVTMVGKSAQQVQAILDSFHEEQKIPLPKRIAISVVSNGWLTLMGAPSSLERLMKFSKELNDAPKVKTDTNGAVHTEYMPKFDLKVVLGDSPILDLPLTPKTIIISPATCQPYRHETLGSLLGEIMVDIAHNILRINDTAEVCISSIPHDKPVSLIVAGPTGHLTAVQRVLDSNGLKHEIRQHSDVESRIAIRGGSDLIAIVGVAGRFPGSDTVEAFFDDLMDGKVQLQKIPASRFNLEKYYDATAKRKNTTSAQYGAFLDQPGHFDNRLFNVSPREAKQMDPLQRLLLTTSYEALENAGYSKDATMSTQSDRIATYFGQASEDWRDVLNNEDIDIYYVPSISRPFGPSRLSYHHKWGGGTYALDAACATSTTAIQLACSALNARECDTAVAGGGSLLVSPNTFAGLSRSGMISNTGGCRTYHDDADGYARGKGIGVVVLKRLEDALADNDNILGVICGSARTYTSTSTSITHPSSESQATIYEEVLRQTSVVPNEVAYVEMHGTGTQAGDFEEMSSVIRVLCKGRSKDNVLTVGAVKANVAHGEGAAGITSLVKVLMMIRERKIPPQPGLPFKVNTNFPKLESLNVRIAGLHSKDMVLKPSPASINGKIKCLVNSFDASGGNTSLLIEEPPELPVKQVNPLPCHTVTFSAKTLPSLQENRRRLLDFLVRNPETKLADVAYTTTARRMHEILRVAYVVKSTKDLVVRLREDVSNKGLKDPKAKSPRTNIVFTFTGQGSQYAGMGRQLFQYSAAFRNTLQTYQEMAKHLGYPHFLHLITDETSDISASSAVIVQLAIVSLEIAITRLLNTWGVKPDMVIGHSLGEYSALCVSGVLSVSDTLFLVGRRAQLMEAKLKAREYAMLAITKGSDAVAELLKSDAKSAWSHTGIACRNAPQATVVSGPLNEIIALKASLETEGIPTTLLEIPFGFHSHHVAPILEEYAHIAKSVNFGPPTTAIVSSLLGEVIDKGQAGKFGPSYLVRQTRECVDFTGALDAIRNHEIAKLPISWVELGPKPVCIGLVRRSTSSPDALFLPTLRASDDDWATIISALASLYQAGVHVDWPEHHKEYQNSLTLLSLPTYAFDEKDFWTPFVERSLPNAMLSQEMQVAAVPPVVDRTFSTTSLQWVEKSEIQGDSISVIFASHTSEPKLYQAIQGHIVNGLTICSLSIFCDMAKSAAQYAHSRLIGPSKSATMSILDVSMTQALVVVEPDPELIVKTEVSYSAHGDAALVRFSSNKGAISTEHGSCKVTFRDHRKWFSELSQTSFLVNNRIQMLKEMSATEKAHRMLKPVVYKLFDNLVTYDSKYQGLQEVWVDSQCQDAVGLVKLPNTTGAGHFIYNPYWIDCAIHLAGFLLNAGLKYAEDIACLSTGFDSWHLLEELQADEIYTSYVSMQETEAPNILSGAAYVFNSQGKLVQVTTGIRFQKMKKLVLNSILSQGGLHTSKASTQTKVTSLSVPEATGSSGFSSPSPESRSSQESGQKSHEQTPGTTTPASSVSDHDEPELSSVLLSVIASEIGISLDDLHPATAFADVGMDSLMAITIIATFEKKSGVELPATFFLEHTTVAESTQALPSNAASKDPGGKIEAPPELSHVPARESSYVPARRDISDENRVHPVGNLVEPVGGDSETQAPRKLSGKVVLLHGSPSSDGPRLFLLPDGSGSPSRYIQLPSLGDQVSVYGLESPFLRSPAGNSCSVREMSIVFLEAIKTVQSDGPYMLGGFSLGALYAYEITSILLKTHEQVEALFIIDMAVPKPLRDPTTPTLQEIMEAGLSPSTGRMTTSQKQHLEKTLQAMTLYHPAPLSGNQKPHKTVLISSKTGLASGKYSPLAQWAQGDMAASRGWATLLGDIETHQIDTDHFAMFRQPDINLLGKVWANALAGVF